MALINMSSSSRVGEIFDKARQFSATERLMLAKLLLDTLVEDNDEQDSADWLAMSLSTFEQDWDNPDDAIYDNWREAYGISKG